LAVLVLVVIVQTQLHISAGWAWIVVLVGIGVCVAGYLRYTNRIRQAPPTSRRDAQQSEAATSATYAEALSRVQLFATVNGESLSDQPGSELEFFSNTRDFTDRDGVHLTGHGIWPAAVFHGFNSWISYDDPDLEVHAGLVHIHVAGVKYRDAATRMTPSGGPGQRLLIIPEPKNEFDGNALAIHTADMLHQLGYVPRMMQPKVRPALDEGWLAITGWEWRYDSGERCAIHVLIATPSKIGELAAKLSPTVAMS
jgi:hypothetical protein